ncbi:DUF5372 family protein [Mesorhizobium sp. M0816]|uniref:DUF5372 family protein n=1 Tax=Mesorhizobium sp. M0816 TaxID=2957006 RepID=UPI00333B9034
MRDRRARPTGPLSAEADPPRSAARRTFPAPSACTSLGNADSTNAVTQLVRITHPFHPLFSRLLPCVGRRYNRHGERLLLQADDTAVWAVPPQWTDLANPDPEVVMGNGRALLRTVDLLELASLVGRLSGKSLRDHSTSCKDNYAASVRRIMPQEGLHDEHIPAFRLHVQH